MVVTFPKSGITESFAHPLNAEDPMEVMVPWAVTEVKFAHPLNMEAWISVMDAGSTMEVMPEPAKVLESVIWIPSGSTMVVRLGTSPLKTPAAAMVLSVLGRLMVVSEVQPSTIIPAFSAMDSTPSAKVMVLIFSIF